MLDQQHVNLTRIGAQHFKTDPIDCELVALVRDASQMIGDQSAYRIDVFTIMRLNAPGSIFS